MSGRDEEQADGCGGCFVRAAKGLLGLVTAIWLVMRLGRLYDAHECLQRQRFRAIEARLGIAPPKEELFLDKYRCAPWSIDGLLLIRPPSYARANNATEKR